MRVQIRKRENSAAVRLPASVMAAARLRIGQAMNAREENGRVVVEPMASVFLLHDMLAKMESSTFPESVDLGRPVGREIW